MLRWLLLLFAILPSEDGIKSAFGNHEGALVIMDVASGGTTRHNPQGCAEKLPPCSTFKIWNSLIGLENGLVSRADEPFYKWDGQKRFAPEWNQDLTFGKAFQYSCVPAFQALARKIGPDRMKTWLDKIGYGDRDTSAGIDVFWLPEPDRKTLLISPDDQVQMIARLLTGQLPFSGKSKAVLKEIMLVKKTERGTFYGKTGTGELPGGKSNLAWFVGYLESHGRTLAFACTLKGPHLMGKDARVVIEHVLSDRGLL